MFIPPAGMCYLDTLYVYHLIASSLVFSAMRALALSNSKLFAALILTLSLIPVGANMVGSVISLDDLFVLSGEVA